MLCSQLEREIPNLRGSGYDRYPISPKTPGLIGYNCIAYAFGDTTRRWWPHPNKFLYYWPPHLQREAPGTETLKNYILAFKSEGYVLCKHGTHKRGIEKVAIFVKNDHPIHAARQLESGLWTSKCGNL